MIAINKFLDRIKVVEAKHDRNLIMSVQDAKDLHTDITKLLIALQVLTENKQDAVSKISITGTDW